MTAPNTVRAHQCPDCGTLYDESDLVTIYERESLRGGGCRAWWSPATREGKKS